MADAIETQPRKKGLLIWLIIAQIGALALIIFWSPLAFFLSGMLTDSGIHGTSETLMWLASSGCLFSPAIIAILCMVIAWIAYAKNRIKLSILFSLLWLIPVALVCIIYFFTS